MARVKTSRYQPLPFAPHNYRMCYRCVPHGPRPPWGTHWVPIGQPCGNHATTTLEKPEQDDFGRAVSRILSAPLRAERIICLSSRYPGPVPTCGTWSGPLPGPLFGLAPDGVFRASALTLGAVGSYPTFSPLPVPLAKPGRSEFLWHCPSGRLAASPPACIRPYGWLRGIAPFGVRTFLPRRLAPTEAILRPSKIKGSISPPSGKDNRAVSRFDIMSRLRMGLIGSMTSNRRGAHLWGGPQPENKE